jgi:tetratricopeptide (TPR) repeat protein
MGKLGAVLKRSEALAETYTRNRPVAIALFRLGEADHSLRGNDGAVNRFCEIPDNKPDVDLEGVAAYWIGESFYRNREYERALRYYKISHERPPKDYESNSAQLPVIRMPEESMGYPRANVTNDVLGPKNVVWHGYAHLPRSASLTVGYT